MTDEQFVLTSWLFLLVALFLIATIALTGIIMKRRHGLTVPKSFYLKYAFYFYLCIVASFTLLPVYYPAIVTYDLEYNLDPRPLFLAFVNRAALITYANNILLFMPITVFGCLGSIKPFRKFKSSLLAVLLISVAIELLQGVEVYLKVVEDFSPVMDINDVICNVIGGGVGFVVAMYYKKSNRCQL